MITKRGAAKGIPLSRIWLEGSRLSERGFKHGSRFSVVSEPGRLTLIVNPEGPRKIAGTPDRPIIDITGKIVREAFTAEMLEVIFSPYQIKIEG